MMGEHAVRWMWVLALSFAGLWARGAERPNILWIVSEDNNPYIGAYGDSVARTPVIFVHGNNDTPFPAACNPFERVQAMAQYFADNGYATSELWGVGYQGISAIWLRTRHAAPRANMTCDTYPREISEQRGRYDDQPTTQGSDARSEQFVRFGRIARSPKGDWRCARIGGASKAACDRF